MTDQQPPNFFDKNTILAILLSFAIFLGWQQYMQKQYPDAYNQETPVAADVQKPETQSAATNIAEKPSVASASTETAQEQVLSEAPKLPLTTETMDLKSLSKAWRFRI